MSPTKQKRGRPPQLSQTYLAWAVVWCLLQGWHAQLELWRVIGSGIGGFAPVLLSNQAIYKRMSQHGLAAMQDLLIQVSGWLAQRLHSLPLEPLAPFARDVLALDESCRDQVGRWLTGLRVLPVGDAALLAGRLCGLFDVRRQCWRRVDVLPHAIVDCKVHAASMLAGLSAGTLLLFDRGYFSFEWFDELTRQGHFWISRMRHKTSYELLHVLVHREGYREVLVFLGAYRADRAEFAVRLIEVRFEGVWYRYLTNVLDPLQLSGAQLVHLYARRWDIELAFRVLKDHLHLRLLWSAKWQVIGVQILACLLLANLFHITQQEVAAGAQVPVFDVSMELLVRYVARFLQQGLDPVSTVLCHGRRLGIIRPSTRKRLLAPEIPWHHILWPPPDLPLRRTPRYAHNLGGHARRTQEKGA